MPLFQGEHLPKNLSRPESSAFVATIGQPAAQSLATAMPDHDVELLYAAVL
jgi:hypothetical protein